MKPVDFNNLFGDADLFLIDFILKGMIKSGIEVLDAGCGSGRHAIYFLQTDCGYRAIDIDEVEVRTVNVMANELGRMDVATQADIHNIPFEISSFDLVLCSRVLHFTRDRDDFYRVLEELIRVTRREGLIYLSFNSAFIEAADTKGRYLLTKEDFDPMVSELSLKIESLRSVLHGNSHCETTVLFRV